PGFLGVAYSLLQRAAGYIPRYKCAKKSHNSDWRNLELWLRMNTTVFETAVSWKHESYETIGTVKQISSSVFNI
ncbi:hypothetical protein L9F63_006101, partial [Diploptera punctata]